MGLVGSQDTCLVETEDMCCVQHNLLCWTNLSPSLDHIWDIISNMIDHIWDNMCITHSIVTIVLFHRFAALHVDKCLHWFQRAHTQNCLKYDRSYLRQFWIVSNMIDHIWDKFYSDDSGSNSRLDQCRPTFETPPAFLVFWLARIKNARRPQIRGRLALINCGEPWL